MINKLLLLFYTLKYLKPTQLAFFIIRRKFPAKHIRFVNEPEIRKGFSLNTPISVGGIGAGNTFQFLNVEKTFISKIDWSPSDTNRLWRYNLHYFDYLREDSRGSNEKTELIKNWIKENPQGSEPGWEPFTASLRIVNWLFFFTKNRSLCTDEILSNLYLQTLWLEKNDERHILANHYFENLKALAFAGCFFQGRDADRWRNKAIDILLNQLEEQTLRDGGHYERSPQYHGLMVENYLDLYNLAINNIELFPKRFANKCSEVTTRGLSFLHGIVFPDDKIPLFNDSAFGISPSLIDLQSYAERLMLLKPIDKKQSSIVDYSESGFFGFRHEDSMFIFDAGDVGPPYQPGHTHCDMLSYELMWHGERIIVDTGVCEYEPGSVRKYVRSTRAHNTISVSGQEQSEVWGEFRVARRAKILNSGIKQCDGSVTIHGSYSGFPTIKGDVIHSRTAMMELNETNGFESIMVKDVIDARYSQLIESFIHLHPDIVIESSGEQEMMIRTLEGYRYQIRWSECLDMSLEDAYYCPEFGLKLANKRIVLSTKTPESMCELSYSISIVH